MRKSSGGAFESRGKFYMRVTIAPRTRPAKLLPWATCLQDAENRAHETQALVNQLRAAGQTDFVEKLVASAATADAEKMAALHRAVAGFIGGELKPLAATTPADQKTFRRILERWTSGELAADYRDHVAKIRSAKTNGHRAKNIPDWALDLPVTSWTAETFERVMRELPKHLSSTTRHHVAQVAHRVLQLSAYPLRLIPSNPIVKGMLPRIASTRELAALFPDEPLMIARTETLDLGERVLICFLAEVGWRISQAVGDDSDPENVIPPLYWRDVRFEHRHFRLLRTKTGGPRKVPLDDWTAAALQAWRSLSPCPKAEDRVFVDMKGRPVLTVRAAERFREMLNAAGINRDTRPELFPETAEEKARSRAVRVHELRSLFVCSSLAHGRSDSWVRDRTLHDDPGMLDVYRRHQHLYEHLPPITPTVEAVPEIAAAAKRQRDAAAAAHEQGQEMETNVPSAHVIAARVTPADHRIPYSGPHAVTRREEHDSRARGACQTTDRNASIPVLPRPAATNDVETALARALEAATTASRFDVVAQLARELEARRLAKEPNVVSLHDRRQSSQKKPLRGT